jgi:hypothetical protein
MVGNFMAADQTVPLLYQIPAFCFCGEGNFSVRLAANLSLPEK